MKIEELEDLKSALEARDYDDISLEVCQAVHDTIKKEKYRRIFTDSEDLNLLDWIDLAGGERGAKGKLDLALIATEMPKNVASIATRIRKGGQLAFHGMSPVPLRVFFNHLSNYDAWLTVEIPLGEGMFIARRI